MIPSLMTRQVARTALADVPNPVQARRETNPRAVPLTELRSGERGELWAAQLDAGDRDLLRALGLADRCRFRLCKAGDPWIVQVRGTRIGLSSDVARRLLVVRRPAR